MIALNLKAIRQHGSSMGLCTRSDDVNNWQVLNCIARRAGILVFRRLNAVKSLYPRVSANVPKRKVSEIQMLLPVALGKLLKEYGSVQGT